jgi:hypothetical protein
LLKLGFALLRNTAEAHACLAPGRFLAHTPGAELGSSHFNVGGEFIIEVGIGAEMLSAEEANKEHSK